MLEPQDFRDVLVIARERSLKAAATVLSVDPSTMGRRLEGIEGRFGSRLFLRTARGFEATAEGLEVVATAEKMESLQLDFERNALARGARGLTITAAEWSVTLLTPILAELALVHPEMPLRLRVDSRALDLARREADIALRLGKPTEETLVGRRAGVVLYGLYGSASYLRRSPAPRDADDARRHTFCSMDADFARTPHVAWQTALAGGARTVLRTNSMLALVEAVRSGAGLATLPCTLAEKHPELRRVLPHLGSVERDLWLVFHRDLRASPGLRPLVDALLARVKPLFKASSAAPAASRR